MRSSNLHLCYRTTQKLQLTREQKLSYLQSKKMQLTQCSCSVGNDGDTTLAEQHLRIDSCGPTFAERHLRTRHLRTNTCGSTFADWAKFKKINKKVKRFIQFGLLKAQRALINKYTYCY